MFDEGNFYGLNDCGYWSWTGLRSVSDVCCGYFGFGAS